ncbi:MAG: hypothetical protein P8X50_09370, partial [Maritimibacter sp.]
MSEKPQLGKRFSHIYLTEDSVTSDSVRMRRRLGACFKRYFPGGKNLDTWLGGFLEAELGIPVVKYKFSSYVDWVDFFSNAERRDVLDALTVAYKAGPAAIGDRERDDLWKQVARIIDEE